MRRKNVFGGCLVVSLLLAASPAAAQEEVSPTLKGITGGAMLGAEIPLMGMSLAGVKNGWVLGLVPVATAAGGGLLGYFYVEQEGNAELAMAMFVGGVALVIPTIGLVANATAYRPEEGESFVEVLPEEEFESDAGVEGGQTDGGVQGGFQFGGSTGGGEQSGEEPSPEERRPAPPSPTGSLLLLRDGALALSFPAICALPGALTQGGSPTLSVSLAAGTF